MKMKVKDTEIVISGIGGKFPESDNIVELQEKLFAKEDFVTNNIRWTIDTVGVGKMHDVDTFDTSPFKMHSKLARSTDPTTTQTLERAFESIIDAGLNPFAMSGRNIAVISASMISDSENTRAGTSYEVSGFTIMGHNRSMVANRISYTFNFTGPSYSIHTSWAGGICALEQGAQLIADGFVEAAVVTTASLIFYKAMGIEYEHLNILTPGGRCRSFDANADGTCRSEGVVSFFIQRASDAKRNYATLMSMRSICLGLRECSLILFDKLLTENLKDFYKASNIDPEDIAYLEADGSGIKMFDTIELNALASVFFGNRKKPLTLGSIKSNVGNTEASASFLGIIKSIIAMETGLIAPNIHFDKPNSDVPALVDGQFQIATEATKLDGNLVAVNSLSLGGSLGHIVLRQNSKAKTILPKGEMPPDGLHRLVTVSARHEEGAKACIDKLLSMPVDVEYAALVNDVFRTNMPGYLWKSYVVLPSTDVKYSIKKCDKEKQPLWYVFSGMGSQWTEMGRDLLTIPVFSAAIDECDKVLRPRKINIRHILTSKDPSTFDNILNSFVGIAAVQIGLVDILQSLGLEPDGMVGHSVGELGCAYADGCFTAQEMVLAAYARGKASLESDVIEGMMAAVGLGYKDMCDRVPASIDVACHNASDSCTLSGPTEDVLNYVKQLKDQKIFAKAVSAGNIAYHSRYIKDIAPKLLKYLKETIPEPKRRSAKWISSSVPETDWFSPLAQMSSPEYHTNNLLSPVLFEEACRYIPDNAIVIEIAPHGLLQAILRRSLGQDCVNVPLTNKQAANGVCHLLEAIGTLYLNNVSVDVNALYPPLEYPVSRGTPCIAPLITFDHHDTWFNEFENILRMRSQRSNPFLVDINESVPDFKIWKEHCIENQVVVPSSQILVYIWKEFFCSTALEVEKEAVLVEDVIISKQILCQAFSQQLMIGIRKGTKQFGVLLREKEVEGDIFLCGKINHISRPTLDLPNETKLDTDEMEVTKDDVLSLFSYFGYNLGPQFQSIKQIVLKNKGFMANVEWTGNMVTFLDSLFKVVQFTEMQREQRFLYPCSFRSLKIDSPRFFESEIGSEQTIWYNAYANILQCQGLLLEGLTFSPDHSIRKKMAPLNWIKSCFVPFNEEIHKLEEFLTISLQLVAENDLNCWKKNATQISVFEIKSHTSAKVLDGVLSKAIRGAGKSLPQICIKPQEIVVGQSVDKIPLQRGDHVLLVGDYNILKQLSSSASNVINLGFIRGQKVPSNGLKPLLTHQLSDGNKLILFKKKIIPNKLRVVELDDKHWLRDVDVQFNGGDNGEPVVVVSSSQLSTEVLPILAEQRYAHRLRCVFLDKSAPKFSISCPLYYNQLSADLSVNHLCQGVWGTWCPLPLGSASLHNSEYSQGNISSLDSSLDVNVVGLNTSHITYHPECPLEQVKVQHVDYCGTRNGERVMGMAQFNSLTNTVAPEDLLSWTIPQQWTMEDAATVPVVYTLAYFCLRVKAQLKTGQKVLVHLAASPIGQACVAVALQDGAQVFVTVENKDQARLIQQAFPQLKTDNVLPIDNFHNLIRQKTLGRGVHVIANCLQNAHTITSTRCLGSFSTIIQMSDIDIRNNNKIGMNMFIKFSQMVGVSLDSIFYSDADIKKKLQMYMRDGIKNLTVRPVQKQLFNFQNMKAAMECFGQNSWGRKTLVVVKPEAQTDVSSNSLSSFQCDPDKTYIVVASAKGFWLDVVEWLIHQGARKLFIASDADITANCFSQRFDRIVSLCYVRIMLTSSTRLYSKTETADFIREAEILGPLAAIFCVGLEENSPNVANLDAVVRQMSSDLQHFVCLLGGGARVCEARAQQGLPSCLIQSKSPLVKPQTILPFLSSILRESSVKGYCFNVSDLANNEEYNDQVDDNLLNFLPQCVNDTVKIIEYVSDRPMLREVVTRSQQYEMAKYNLLPVFILPGTNPDCLQCFTRHLMHPAFCATLPTIYHSVETSANMLLREVTQIQSRGPYNLVAESWGGALALQLAVLLEAQGHQVDLFLIDAAPSTMQKLTKIFSDKKKSNLDLNLLVTLFNLENEVVERLAKLKTWEDQVHSATQFEQFKIQVKPEQVRSIQERAATAATAVRNHLTALHTHNPPPQLVRGSVHLLRPNYSSDIDFCGLQLYCQQRPIVHVMEDESHAQMLRNPETATIVNENLAYTWGLW